MRASPARQPPLTGSLGITAGAERLQTLGAMIVAPERRSPDYLAGFVKSEIEKWAEPIKKSGAQLD